MPRPIHASAARTPLADAWWGRYLPIPFVERGRSFAGCDCRGLGLLILEEERGVRVPEPCELYGSTDPRNGRELADFFAGQAALWRPVKVAPFALLSFAVAGLPVHMGVSLGGVDFIHTQRGAGVRVSSLTDREAGEIAWGKRLMGAWRYAG